MAADAEAKRVSHRSPDAKTRDWLLTRSASVGNVHNRPFDVAEVGVVRVKSSVSTPGTLSRLLAYLQIASYKVAFALALLGGGVDGFAMEEVAKGIVEWAEEDISQPAGRSVLHRPSACTLSGKLPLEPHSSLATSQHASPVRPGHSLPNGLRAPLRC